MLKSSLGWQPQCLIHLFTYPFTHSFIPEHGHHCISRPELLPLAESEGAAHTSLWTGLGHVLGGLSIDWLVNP